MNHTKTTSNIETEFFLLYISKNNTLCLLGETQEYMLLWKQNILQSLLNEGFQLLNSSGIGAMRTNALHTIIRAGIWTACW